MKEELSGLLCAICSAAADGLHYGAISCRSCNAFFRRAVTFNQRYTCRKDNDCDVNQHVRCACRACRFAKCLLAGMKISAVQPRRDPTGSQKDRRRRKRSQSEISSSVFSPQVHIKSEAPDEQPSTSSVGASDAGHDDKDESNLEENAIFERMVLAYRDHMRHMQLAMTSVPDFLQEHDSGITYRKMMPTDVEKLSNVELSGLLFWIEKQHPFRDLHASDRTALLKRYSVRKLSLDHFYHASKHKAHLEVGNFVMLNNTFVPPGYTGFEGIDDDEKQIAAKQEIFLPTFERIWRCVIAPFVMMKITDAEIVFLHSMLLWSPLNNSHVLPPTKEIMRKRREWSISRLFEWYESHGEPSPETRLGEVILLLSEIEVICDQHCQDFQVAKLFEFCDMSKYWYESLCYSSVNTMQHSMAIRDLAPAFGQPQQQNGLMNGASGQVNGKSVDSVDQKQHNGECASLKSAKPEKEIKQESPKAPSPAITPMQQSMQRSATTTQC